MTESDWKDIKYFTRREFRCLCGCGISNPSLELIQRLDSARERAGIPFRVSSGSRCVTHNASRGVGGVDSSSHVANETQESYAGDIIIFGSRSRNLIQAALIEVGFNRFGLGDRFIHTDIDPTKDPNVTWLY
jgi:zinc D-Ala-D-Ala carboxypeptidase